MLWFSCYVIVFKFSWKVMEKKKIGGITYWLTLVSLINSPPPYSFLSRFQRYGLTITEKSPTIAILSLCSITDYNMKTRWKVLGLAYNRRETQDKRLLGRDPDRSQCHLHTSLKLFWLHGHRPRHMSVLLSWSLPSGHLYRVSHRL